MTSPASEAFDRPAGPGARRQHAPQRPWQPPRPVRDAVKSAQAAGLEYIGDDAPGIRRVRRGKGFSYVGADSRPIHDPTELARIRALAIPPAWTEVWICPLPNGHLQATGRDARGRKQYRYHVSWGEQRSSTKYSRMLLFGAALPAIRARIEHDLALRGLPRDKVLATVLRVMELTFIRVGNREYARANKSFGLTTLRDGHVQISGTQVHFSFRGKSGQHHDVDVRDRRLARIIQQCRDVPGYELFQYYDGDGAHQAVGSGDVNNYLREVTGQDFSAKDFRTWGGTVLAARELSQLWPTEARLRKKNIAQAIRKVANELGNRPATCRKYYVHPAIVDAYLDGSLAATLKEYAALPAADLPPGLSADESAVLALLREKLGLDGAGDDTED